MSLEDVRFAGGTFTDQRLQCKARRLFWHV